MRSSYRKNSNKIISVFFSFTKAENGLPIKENPLSSLVNTHFEMGDAALMMAFTILLFEL